MPRKSKVFLSENPVSNETAKTQDISPKNITKFENVNTTNTTLTELKNVPQTVNNINQENSNHENINEETIDDQNGEEWEGEGNIEEDAGYDEGNEDVVEEDVNEDVNEDANGNEIEVKVPKKRGRKPKNKELIITSNNNSDGSTSDDISIKTKRRGRKPKDKFKYENSDFDEFNKNNRKEDNIIVKLPLSCLRLNQEFNNGKDLFNYTPVISNPKPYNPIDLGHNNHIGYSKFDNNNNEISSSLTSENDFNDNEIDNSQQEFKKDLINVNLNPTNFNPTEFNNYFDNMKKESGNGLIPNNNNNQNYCENCKYCKDHSTNVPAAKKEDVRQIDIILNNKYNSNTDKFSVLTHLSTGIQNTKWPEKTEIACLWCCHTFTNTPWGVPYKYVNGVFQLFGNNCSPNCALAYILNFYINDETKWEKIALLNLLYFKVYGNYKNLMPALDKMALKNFGGTLEIDEYRKISTDNEKAYNIEFPPCNTIIPMLEEIYKKNNLNNTFIPVDKNRIQIASSELKLKRSKPIINYKNTLDFSLGKVNG